MDLSQLEGNVSIYKSTKKTLPWNLTHTLIHSPRPGRLLHQTLRETLIGLLWQSVFLVFHGGQAYNAPTVICFPKNQYLPNNRRHVLGAWFTSSWFHFTIIALNPRVHWECLCYLACELLFFSLLHVTSYPTGSVSKVVCHACLMLSTCSGCVYFFVSLQWLSRLHS